MKIEYGKYGTYGLGIKYYSCVFDSLDIDKTRKYLEFNFICWSFYLVWNQ